MILLAAIFLGLFTGMVRAELAKRHYQPLAFNKPGLVILAFLFQFGILQLHRIGIRPSDDWFALTLVICQILLVIFTVYNREKPGFPLLVLGTVLNLLVMLINGGLMPMTPETITNLYPQASPQSWVIGEHLWNSKNIVLTEEMTRLSYLSDRILIPEWAPYRVAFSLGDVILSAGAFWLFWSLGGKSRKVKEFTNEQYTYKPSPLRTDWRKSHRKGIQPDPYRRSH